jgi:hypothetical protein
MTDTPQNDKDLGNKTAEELTDDEVLEKLFPPKTVEIIEESSTEDKDT